MLGIAFRFNVAGIGWFLLRCLFSLLFRRRAGLLYGGRKVCLGRRGTRLRLGDRRRGLGEKIEKGALLRHVSEFQSGFRYNCEIILRTGLSLHHLAASQTRRERKPFAGKTSMECRGHWQEPHPMRNNYTVTRKPHGIRYQISFFFRYVRMDVTIVYCCPLLVVFFVIFSYSVQYYANSPPTLLFWPVIHVK